MMNIHFRRWVRAVAMLLASATLDAGARAAEDEPRFPEAADAWFENGSWVDPVALQHVAPGLTRDQVRGLIGVPHFSEGFRVRDWNYVFQLRIGGVQTACQYQVRFDDQGRVRSVHWRRTGGCETVSGSAAS